MKALAPQKTTDQQANAPQEAAAGSSMDGGLVDQDQIGNAEVAARLKTQSEAEVSSPAPNGQTNADLDQRRPVGGLVDSATRTDLFARMQGTPESKSVLDKIKKIRGNLNIKFAWSQQGSYHRAGEIYLDRNKDVDALVATTAHELNHLLTYLSGQAGNIQRDDRETFIKKQMDDEIQGQAIAYITLLQLGTTNDSSSAGFNEFVRLLRRKHKDLLSSDLRGGLSALFGGGQNRESDWEGIREIAQDFIRDKFETDPAWLTSNTKENYFDYYGNAWDNVRGG